MKKEIVIGCDNAAVGLKKVIMKLLDELGYKYEDVGVTGEEDQTYYPNVAKTGFRKDHCQRLPERGHPHLRYRYWNGHHGQ